MWKIFTEKKIQKVEKKIHEFIPNILATEFFATYSEFFSTIFRRIFEYTLKTLNKRETFFP